MKSRLAVILAVVVPIVALGAVISQRDSSRSLARLPITLGGTAGVAGTADAAFARPSLYPYGGIVYKAGPDLPALAGSARAYKVTPDPDLANRLRAVFSAESLSGALSARSSSAIARSSFPSLQRLAPRSTRALVREGSNFTALARVSSACGYLCSR